MPVPFLFQDTISYKGTNGTDFPKGDQKKQSGGTVTPHITTTDLMSCFQVSMKGYRLCKPTHNPSIERKGLREREVSDKAHGASVKAKSRRHHLVIFRT